MNKKKKKFADKLYVMELMPSVSPLAVVRVHCGGVVAMV